MYDLSVGPDERQSLLIDLLQRDGRVEVAGAAARFGTAEMTVRRDLDVLVSRGVARRVRGGAVSLLMRGEELPFSMRALEANREKREIGRAAAALLADGECVVLDSGTTALEVARSLGGRRLTIMALSLHAANAVSSHASPRLIMPGGEVRDGELALVGPLALASLQAMRFDTALVSCCGLAGGVLTAYDLGDAAVKKAAMNSAARTVLVAESAKFARSAMAVVCPANEVDTLVTDQGAPADVVASLRLSGVEVVLV
jgi:DeoR/GlpR family transcriptional regulator of sugar metabolism